MKPNLSDPQKRQMFSNVKFGTVTAKNRVVMAPIVNNFGGPADDVTDRQISYYIERARGGVGTIVVEACSIRRSARIATRQIGAYDDRLIPGLRRLARAIQAADCVALIQLCHGGPKIHTASGYSAESVSAVAVLSGSVPRVLSAAELLQVRRDFVVAARRAQQAGFDGVEIHAAHFYLLSASLSPYTNKRTDSYGGKIQNRARLTREVIEDIKADLGTDFPVWVRMHGREDLDPGLSLDDSRQAAVIFADAGADAVHVSAYTIPAAGNLKKNLLIPVTAAPLTETPAGPFLNYAAAIKEVVDVPVIAVGKLDDPLLAASALTEGKCDMIALARQLLCDPYWVLKVREGRAEEIIHCNYCLACHNKLQSDQAITCAQNLNLYGKPVYSN